MSDMKNKEILWEKEYTPILRAISSVADSFYNQNFNNEVSISELARKYYENAIVLVAYDDDTPVGMAGFYANDAVERRAFLSTIVVNRKYQGQQTGHLLYNRIIEISREHGMKRLRLEVDKTNDHAIAFYKKRGMNVVSENSTSYFMEVNIDN